MLAGVRIHEHLSLQYLRNPLVGVWAFNFHIFLPLFAIVLDLYVYNISSDCVIVEFGI